MSLTNYELSRARGIVDESSLERAGGHQIDWAAVTADADGQKRLTALAVMGRKPDGKLVPRATTIALSAVAIAGSVATATSEAHGLAVGERIAIAGATPAWLNGEYVIATVADADTFTVAVSQPARAPDVRAVTLTVATDLVGLTGHGLVAGDIVEFDSIVTTTGLTAGTNYYVIAGGLTADVFKVSATAGGTAIDLDTNNGTALMRVLSGGTYAASGTVTAARAAVGLLETNAAENAAAHALSGYSLLVGGVVYENWLPNAAGTPKVLPAAQKAELISAGCSFKFVAYADSRAD